MPKQYYKINRLILLAVTFSSLTLALYAYRSFLSEAFGYGIIFTLLSISFISAVIWGLINNAKYKSYN